MATAKPYTPPKSIAACADALYTTRQARLDLKKQVDILEAQEALLREHIIANLPKSQATGIAGKIARATIVMKDVVQVEDWDKVYAYIAKNQARNPGVWALMQRRIGEAAVKEVWNAGKTIPGTAKLEIPTVSLNKL